MVMKLCVCVRVPCVWKHSTGRRRGTDDSNVCMCVCRFGPRAGTYRGSHHPDYDPEVVGETVVKVRIEKEVCCM